MTLPNQAWTAPAAFVKQAALVLGGHTTLVGRDQYNYHRKVLRTNRIDVAVGREFEPPPHFGRAREKMDEYGVVVLKGEVGTGRRTSAICLLHSIRTERSGTVPELHELTDEWERLSVGDLPQHRDCLYLLDLGFEDLDLSEGFGRDLAAHGAKLHELGSRLVVVATPEQWRGCGPTTLGFTVDLELPLSHKVAAGHLEHRLRSGSRCDHLAAEELRDVLNEHTGPGQAVRVAEAIAAADTDADGWLRNIVQQLSNWPDYVTRQFESEQGLPRRALLLAVAVQDNARVARIATARDLLLEELGAPHGAAQALAQADLSGQLKVIEAKLTAGVASLTAARPGLDQVVLNHVWLNYPEIQDTLLSWMAKLVAPGGIASADPERVATMLVALAAELQDPSIIKRVVNRADKGPGCRRLAEQVVLAGVCHPVVGQGLRRNVLEWARSSSLHNQRTVLLVCSGEFATGYPDAALTRIRWLLDSAHAEIRIDAAKLLRTLVGGHREPRLFLEQAVEKVRGNSYPKMFAALITPGESAELIGRLAGDETLLAHGWRTLFGDSDLEEQALEAVLGWIRACADGTLDFPRALTIMFDALWSADRDGCAPQVLFRVGNAADESMGELWLELLRRRPKPAIILGDR